MERIKFTARTIIDVASAKIDKIERKSKKKSKISIEDCDCIAVLAEAVKCATDAIKTVTEIELAEKRDKRDKERSDFVKTAVTQSFAEAISKAVTKQEDTNNGKNDTENQS